MAPIVIEGLHHAVNLGFKFFKTIGSEFFMCETRSKINNKNRKRKLRKINQAMKCQRILVSIYSQGKERRQAGKEVCAINPFMMESREKLDPVPDG